jgi:hypothetical protein
LLTVLQIGNIANDNAIMAHLAPAKIAERFANAL